VQLTVAPVTLPRIPTKIRQVVVGRVPIREVAAFHPLRARPDKRLQDEMMHKPSHRLAVPEERHAQVTVCAGIGTKPEPHRARLSRLTACNSAQATPNRPIIPDPVADEPRNVAVLSPQKPSCPCWEGAAAGASVAADGSCRRDTKNLACCRDSSGAGSLAPASSRRTCCNGERR
jgi:hypothetical protein